MHRARLIAGMFLLTVSGFAQQQPDTSQIPNPNPPTTYNQPVEIRHGYGNWGLLGLFGLCGLFGRRRRETIVRDRDEYVTEQRRRVA